VTVEKKAEPASPFRQILQSAFAEIPRRKVIQAKTCEVACDYVFGALLFWQRHKVIGCLSKGRIKILVSAFMLDDQQARNKTVDKATCTIELVDSFFIDG